MAELDNIKPEEVQLLFKNKKFGDINRIVGLLINDLQLGNISNFERLTGKRFNDYDDVAEIVKIGEGKKYGYTKRVILERLISGRLYEASGAAVDMVIISANGRVLLIKRGYYPYGYALPGGFIDKNETSELAAWRELGEETGLVKENVLKGNVDEIKKAIELFKKNLDLLQLPVLINHFDVTNSPRRDPRGNVTSDAFVCVSGRNHDAPEMKTEARDDALALDWVSIEDVKKLIKRSKDASHEDKDLDFLTKGIAVAVKLKGKEDFLMDLKNNYLAFDHWRILEAAFDKLEELKAAIKKV